MPKPKPKLSLLDLLRQSVQR